MGIAPETEESKSLEMLVQPYAANIFMTNTLIESIVSSVLVLFIGPWSDKFGRKPILLGIFSGYLVAYSLVTLLSMMSLKFPINPWFYLSMFIPISLTGGFCALITITYCYISDVVKDEKSRARRMLLLEISIFGGISLGSLTCSFIYEATNGITIFAISTFIVLIALLGILFILPESLSEVSGGSKASKMSEFFRWELARDLLRTVFERRPNYDRAIIWLIMVSIGLAVAAMQGDSNLSYLYLREMFEWDLKEYNIYVTISIVYQVFFSFIAIVAFRKSLKMSLAAMCLLAYGSGFMESLIKGLAQYSWQVYLGVGFGMFKGIGGPMCRAIISQVSSPSDLGKIFAFTTSLETIFPLATAPLYTYLYNTTLGYMPGAFNLLSASFNLIGYIFTAIIFGIQIVYPTVTYDVIGA
ncbi:hypothetical protein ACFFRR_007650 [Megaselia abdita]